MSDYKLSPSIFAADLGHIADQLAELEAARIEMLHVDVLDGHFVERMAFGADHIRALKKLTSIPLDVHLMVEKPERILDDILDAGADIVTVHQESTAMLTACLEKIRAAGAKAGVVLSPATPAETLSCVLDQVDMILCMTINPGAWGKQPFKADVLKKVTRLREMLDGRDIDIEVDGSVDDKNIAMARDAGANVFVSGGYLFSDIASNAQALRDALAA